MRVPLAGGPPERILVANWISNHQCARVPDTTCIYSVIGERSLTFFTFDPFKGKGKQIFRIADDFLQFFNWTLSPDGSTLAIIKAKTEEQPRNHLVSLNGAPKKWLSVQGWPGLAALDWAADSKSLWSPSAGDDENTLLNIDLQGHVRAAWRPKRKSLGWAIPSRDGRSLALYVGSTSSNAWMLERH